MRILEDTKSGHRMGETNVPGDHNTERREVYYQGMVQGVGFRYTARQLAANFAVSGFVRNLPDGRVYLVAEGPSDQLRDLLDSVQDRLGHYIVNAAESSSEAKGQFRGFEIRR